VQTDAIVVSVDYRHAPEARFPAAAHDGVAALRWVAEHAEQLGGAPGALAAAGWSAGGNVAAVACQVARDTGGPAISAQLMLCPVTDSDLTRESYVENAEGYGLTRDLMVWFWGHYADEADRTDPMAAPLRATSLAGLPPAVVVTCEFDPLRDEGNAYAMALADAGVLVDHIRARGHTHTSIPAVDALVTGAPVREKMFAALRTHLAAKVPA
jgi:acetyl esterase/lipase